MAVDPITATGPAEILYSGAPSAFAAPIYLCVTVRTDDDPASFRIVFNREDADNFHFVEIAVDTTITAQFGKSVAGNERLIGDEIELVADLTVDTIICLCFEAGASQEPIEDVRAGYAQQGDSEMLGWTDPGNINAADGLVAATSVTDDTATDALLASDFGINVPLGCSIDGMTFGVGVERDATDGTVEDLAMVYITDTETSDNMAVGTTVPDVGSGASIQYGGPTDLSGASPTYEDVNDEDLTFRMVFTAVGVVGSSPLGVDWVLFIVNFTTPPNRPASVKLYVDGECVVSTRLPYIGDGTGIALAAVTGDWEWSDFSLRYAESESRPSCDPCPECGTPPPCPCCDMPDFPPAAAYVIDLGAGGLTNIHGGSNCTSCENIAGEYTLETAYGCGWIYEELLEPCSVGGTPCETFPLLMILQLVADDENPGECKWQLSILTSDSDVNVGFGGCAAHYRIRYTYEASLASGEDCQTMPVTLNRVFNDNGECGGDLPATITLDLA